MSIEAVRNRKILSPEETKTRRNAYKRVYDEGLLRFSTDSMYVIQRFAQFKNLLVQTLEFKNPGRVFLESALDLDNDQENLRAINVVLGTLLGGDGVENIHYVFKKDNLIKRTRGAFRGEEKIVEFQTGFENVDAQEADSLADYIKEPNIDHLRKYRESIRSNERAKPFNSAQKFTRIR